MRKEIANFIVNGNPVEEPVPSGPFGAKGVGEPGLVNVAPSIANAVYDATGGRIYTHCR